jgi:hypothetical protein
LLLSILPVLDTVYRGRKINQSVRRRNWVKNDSRRRNEAERSKQFKTRADG